jgi:hypothetical protein
MGALPERLPQWSFTNWIEKKTVDIEVVAVKPVTCCNMICKKLVNRLQGTAEETLAKLHLRYTFSLQACLSCLANCKRFVVVFCNYYFSWTGTKYLISPNLLTKRVCDNKNKEKKYIEAYTLPGTISLKHSTTVITRRLASFLTFSRMTRDVACLFRKTHEFSLFQISQEMSKTRETIALRLGVEPSDIFSHHFLVESVVHWRVLIKSVEAQTNL